MKKLYTILFCALMAVSADAQGLQSALKGATPAQMKTSAVLPRVAKKSVATKAVKQPRVMLEEVATEQPEGTLIDKMLHTNDCYNSWYGYVEEDEPSVGRIVIDEENNVMWVYNLLHSANFGIWTKGVIDGETVTFAPATYDYNYNGTIYTFTLQKAVYNSSTDLYEADTDGDGSYTMSWKDGVLQSVDESMYASFYDGEWNYQGDLNIVIKENPYTAIYVDDVQGEWEDYTCTYVDLSTSENATQAVKLAFVDDKVYVNGFAEMNADACFVGTVSGNTVTFESGQYVDIDPTYDMHTFMHADTVVNTYYEDYEAYYLSATIMDKVVCTFDTDTKTITLPDSTAISIDGKENEVYYAGFYMNAVFGPFTEKPGVPRDPSFYEEGCFDYNTSYGYGGLGMFLPDSTVDGNFIPHGKLFYSFFIDDETDPIEFYQEDGYTMEDGCTEIPYDTQDYTNYNVYKYNGVNYVYYFFSGFDSIGVQLIYHAGDGETYKSNTVYWKSEAYTGIDQVTGHGSQVTGIAYYDLMGRRMRAAGREGVYIRETTYADGKKKSVKFVGK